MNAPNLNAPFTDLNAKSRHYRGPRKAALAHSAQRSAPPAGAVLAPREAKKGRDDMSFAPVAALKPYLVSVMIDRSPLEEMF